MLAMFLLLGSPWPGENWGEASRALAGRAQRRLTIELSAAAENGPAPFTPVVTARISGPFTASVLNYTCVEGGEEFQTPVTFGGVCGQDACYMLDQTCTYNNSGGSNVMEVWFDTAQGEVSDTITLSVDEVLGQVAIVSTAVSEDPCVLPCSDLTLSMLARDGTTDYTLKTDVDDSCATSTTDCADACWETRAANDVDGLILAAALPDLAGAGIKQLRVCVLDEVPSSAFDQVQFEAQSSAIDLSCTATSDPTTSASSPLNNVALEVDCSGGTSAAGCDLIFDCDVDTAGSAPSSLYTNNFETVGAAGCDDQSSAPSGTTSCAGGTASAGTGSSATHALFFQNAWVSPADELTVTIDDLTISSESGNANQNRFNLRDNGTNKFRLQTGTFATKTLRLECPVGSCTTAGGQYTTGVPFDVSINVNTANGRGAILNAAGDELCFCSGTAATEVDGFVVNGGQAVVSMSAVTVVVPGGGSTDPTPVTANTTWPYNTEAEATENCDGYTTGTTTARVTVACPDSETIPLDIPVQVTAAPTFSITSITTNVGATCTVGDCVINEVTLVYAGTATGTVSAIGCTMEAGNSAESLTTTTDAASPFALRADGGWGGYEYTTSGTKTLTCTATRQGVTATSSVQVQVNDPVVPVTDLVVSPLFTGRSTTPGGTPTPDTITLSDASGGTIPFTCVESPPVSWMSLSNMVGDTPTTLTRTYTSFATTGDFCTNIVCSNDDDTTDTATAQTCVNASAPAGGDPTWSSGRDPQGQLLVNAGPSYGTVAMKVDHRPGTTQTELHFNQFDIAYPNSMVFRNSQLLNNYANDPNGTNIGNDKDTMRFAYGSVVDQMKYLLMKSVTVKNAQFTGTGPHADVFQIIGLESGVGNHFLFEALVAQNFYIANSDSGQAIWATTMQSESGKPFTYYVLHEGTITQESAYTTQCGSRGSGGTRRCGAPIHVNMPYNPNGTMYRWVVAVDGSFTMEGGSSTECQDDDIIMIQTTGTILSSACIPAGLRHTYPNIEAALAAGWPEPPFMRLTCGGWATPPPGCVSGKGYVASN